MRRGLMITIAAPALAASTILGMVSPAPQASAAPAASGATHGPRPAGHRRAVTVYVGYTTFRPRPHKPPRITGTIVPISAATNKAGQPIPIRGGVGDIAISPDGTTAYVASDDFLGAQAGTVTPIRTATNTPGTPIRIRGGAGVVAFTPDGKTAYVGGQDKITPIHTATSTAGKPIRIYGAAVTIAITHDGKTAYVLTNAVKSGIIPIHTATNTAGKPIHVCRARPGTNPILNFPHLIAITPDGKTLYVGCEDGTVIPIRTATNTPGRAIRVRGGAITIAFTPDSKIAYVGDGGTVTPISTATNRAGKPIRVGLPVVEVMAVTPDGKTVYVTHYEGRATDTIVPISTATNKPGSPIHIGSGADALAITPHGKTLYAATFPATRDTVTPIRTATNRAQKPIFIHRGHFIGGELLAITP